MTSSRVHCAACITQAGKRAARALSRRPAAVKLGPALPRGVVTAIELWVSESPGQGSTCRLELA